MISFAQNFEDVMIARLFPQDHQGFYIDVGAADPFRLSVTKHFYDAGWHGINVEPLPRFHQRLSEARPRDVNVQAVIGTKQPSRTFFEIAELPENSTSDESVMEQLKAEGQTVHTHQVEVVTLEELCDRHVGDRQIDFMKIDVEGGELEVLQSADWQRFRPILLVIEAVVVNGRQETWSEWEHVLTSEGYIKVWFDGLNNYYLRQESIALKEHFRLPPNVFDAIELAHPDPEGNGWEDLSEKLRRIDADRAAKQEIVDRLIIDLTAANADREAKQEVVDRLIGQLASANESLAAANADGLAKQQRIDELGGRVATLEAKRKWFSR